MEQKTTNIPGNTSLQGRKVVLLGGSSGLGLEVARASLAQGAEVVIVSSNPQRIDQALAELGGNATGSAVDLANEAAIEAWFKDLGPFDHLVYTAADSLQLTALSATDLKDARHMLELRFWSAVAAVKYATPNIRPGGSITLTTGTAAQRPEKGWVIVSSIAAMLEGLTRALAVELAPLRVNCVSAGVTRTNLWQSIPEQARNAMFENLGRNLLLGRVGEAPEIAQTYLYLMQQSFSTGQIVVVDGGTSLV